MDFNAEKKLFSFVFSFEEGKEEGELCLRPETAPLKISSVVKKKEEKTFAKLSFFLSFFRQRKGEF